MVETVSTLSRKIRNKCKEITALLGKDENTKAELNVNDLLEELETAKTKCNTNVETLHKQILDLSRPPIKESGKTDVDELTTVTEEWRESTSNLAQLTLLIRAVDTIRSCCGQALTKKLNVYYSDTTRTSYRDFKRNLGNLEYSEKVKSLMNTSFSLITDLDDLRKKRVIARRKARQDN